MIPLSFAQRRLWFLWQAEGSSSTYASPLILRLTGPLDRAALAAGLRDVIGRHEALRTVFPAVDGGPVQRIIEDRDVSWGLPVVHVAAAAAGDAIDGRLLDLDGFAGDQDVVDLPVITPAADLPGAEIPASQLAASIARTAAYEFDLAAEIPIRAWLFAVRPDEHVLVIVIHHIAGDGWSYGPLGRDLAAAYAARRDGVEPQWTALPLQYADYALWQHELLADEDDDSVLSRQLDYWRRALADLPEETALPTDKARPAVPSHDGHMAGFAVSADVHRGLARLARERRATAFMVLQAALAVTLSALGAGEDVPIGSAVSGRSDPALDDLIGCFVNTLVVRTDLSGNPTFAEVLERVRQTVVGAVANQDVPFERLVEELAPTRSAARHPLFQVVMTMQDFGSRPALDGVRADTLSIGRPTAKFDLDVMVGETFDADGAPSGLRGIVTAAADLFGSQAAARIGGCLVRVLAAMAADPDARVGSVDLLEGAERRRVLVEWNDTAVEVGVSSVVELFAGQVARVPDAVAVVFGDDELTYQDLDARANRLAWVLRDAGVGAESVVALCLPRGVEMIAAILAVWKAGAAYLPIDPGFPVDRVSFMLGDSRAAVLVGARDVLDELPVRRMRMVALDDARTVAALAAASDADPGVRVLPGQVAYVVYTSGSTGVPKGVAVTHGGLANYVASVPQRVGFGAWSVCVVAGAGDRPG